MRDVTDKKVWSNDEPFSVMSGPLVTKGNVAFYGTSEGYFKAVRLSDGQQLYRFRIGTGVISNPITFENKGRQYVAVLAGTGGMRGIGISAGIYKPTEHGYEPLYSEVTTGGQLLVFALPQP